MSEDRVLAHFAEQAAFCTTLGSPFTGELILRMHADVVEGGPIAALMKDWPTNPRADALALRLAGAFHHAVLSGRDAALAVVYPGHVSDWNMDQVWPLARAFATREQSWMTQFITSAPQTNETRRSIALLAGFLDFARNWHGPIDTLEIGASAGLNLHWEKFAYRTKTWSWGGDSAVVIDTDWNGAPPAIEANVNIRNRAACDLNPLDISDPQQRLQLKSYVWPDQPDRLTRFDGAVRLALQHDVKVERADAAAWLSQRLAQRADDAATIVYHSVFLQYPPREAREAIVNAIKDAGASATAAAPVVWVRMEPEALTDGNPNGMRMVVDMTAWPGGERRVLAYTDGHVRAVYAA